MKTEITAYITKDSYDTIELWKNMPSRTNEGIFKGVSNDPGSEIYGNLIPKEWFKDKDRIRIKISKV